MTDKRGNSNDHKPGNSSGNLERWLQLPDSYQDDDVNNVEHPDSSPELLDESDNENRMLDELNEDTEDVPDYSEHTPAVEDTEENASEKNDDQAEPLILFDDTVLDPVEKSEPAVIDTASTEENIDGGDSPDKYEHHFEIPLPPESFDEPSEEQTDEESQESDESEDEILLLEDKLGHEFRDTLTAANASALPLGIFFILLSLIGYFHGPIANIIGVSTSIEQYNLWVLVSTGILALGGIHLLIYWIFHRISNAVKSRELDRLIERRRFIKPCGFLDCDEPDDIDEITDEAGLAWRCTHYDVSLEGSLICAVCDHYCPGDPNDDVIVDDG